MKLRPVTCIHVAAYMFSALVLGASAVSYYRHVELSWITGTSRITLVSSRGQFHLSQVLYWPFHKNFVFRIDDRVPWWPFEEFHRLSNPEVFLGITHGVYGLKVDADISICHVRYAVAPQYYFLIPPLAWMCGFHLFRLRRRFRASDSQSQIQPGVTGAS